MKAQNEQNLGKVLAVTGASGNMGKEVIIFLAKLENISKIKLLLLNKAKERRYYRNLKIKYGKKVTALFGDIGDLKNCKELVKNVDYVINLAAVIPPKADHFPILANECNYVGVKNLVTAISEIKEKQPKFIHISTVAVYGNRNHLHPWGRVGDPLIPSVYDSYATSKIKGERYVLDSDINNWAILRQTGILHMNMLTDNLRDGLMFHTPFNVPIEWVTARDSGRLIANIIKKDMIKNANGFWKKCYNIGGGLRMRSTGYETFESGFKLIGGSTEKFFKPFWNVTRNFHCMWYYDSDVLNDTFDFQYEGTDDYWREMDKKHKYYQLARLFPPKLISKLAIERLLTNKNAPMHWLNTGDEGRVKAYFGSAVKAQTLADKWSDCSVFAKGEIENIGDFEELKKKENAEKLLLSHGYDETKKDCDLDISDMKKAAAFRGGKCLSESMVKGDLYTKLLWECFDGHKFYASPYTVIKAGHWCPICCMPEPWNYDYIAKNSPFYAQIWYDTHTKEENTNYYFDEQFNAKFIEYKQGMSQELKEEAI